MGIGSMLFGGGKTASQAKLQPRFGQMGIGGIADYLGYKQTGDWSKGTKTAWDWKGYQTPTTVDSSNAGYDYSGMDQALAKYKAGPQSTYTAQNFNYASLPDQYYTDQMAQGAGDINRQGAGQLAKLQEAVGVRNAGRLAKLGTDQNRLTGENLASMYTGLRGQQAAEKTKLGVQQQQDQAAENARAFGLNTDQTNQYLAALADLSNKKLAQQSNNYQYERSQKNDLLKTLLANYSANRAASGGKSQGGLMNSLVGAAGQVGSAYAGKKA